MDTVPSVPGSFSPTPPMKTAAAALAAALAASAAGAHAQGPALTPFSVELRGGAAVPAAQGEFDRNVGPGYTAGGGVGFQVAPLVGLYAGYTRSVFPASDDGELGGDGDLVIAGLDAGVRLDITTPGSRLDPFVRAGVLYGRLQAEGFADAETNFRSGSSLGYQVGAGVGIDLLPRVQLTPAVTFTGFRFETDDARDNVAAGHVRLDVGLRVRI